MTEILKQLEELASEPDMALANLKEHIEIAFPNWVAIKTNPDVDKLLKKSKWQIDESFYLKFLILRPQTRSPMTAKQAKQFSDKLQKLLTKMDINYKCIEVGCSYNGIDMPRIVIGDNMSQIKFGVRAVYEQFAKE